jgi:ParB family chromosome partitioning protein
MLRVLQLPEVVRRLLQDGQLSMGHAKVLLGLEDPATIASLAHEIVKEGLTVREVERRLREFAGLRTTRKAGRPRSADQLSPEVKHIQDRLRRHLQTDVTVSVGNNNRGTLTLHFYSVDDLERLLDVMRVPD